MKLFERLQKRANGIELRELERRIRNTLDNTDRYCHPRTAKYQGPYVEVNWLAMPVVFYATFTCHDCATYSKVDIGFLSSEYDGEKLEELVWARKMGFYS